jgi:two-component system sensor kinase FixL
MQKAAEQIGRTGEIIRRLRTFVRKGEARRRTENVAQMVEEACALALVGVKSDGVRVAIRMDGDASNALVDKIQVQQVLVNLMRNAVEAMAQSPRRELTIATRASADATVEISIADTGPGIAPQIREKLFEPFVTSKATGMGVGLSLCRSIIEAHGGRLWADDNPQGGATFRFTIASSCADVADHTETS